MEFASPSWFARSAVVDPQGVIMPVYHWTDMGDFDVFRDSNDIGFHFGSRQTAEVRAQQVRGPKPASDGERMIVAYLKILRPLDLPDLHDWNPGSVIGAFAEANLLSPERIDAAYDEIIDREWVIEALREYDYDGIHYQNETEGRSSWIALHPSQIHIVRRERLTPETN